MVLISMCLGPNLLNFNNGWFLDMTALRDRTNELFTSLKELRGKLDEEFERLSKDNFERFNQMLADLEKKKVSDGLRLQPLFDDLKEMQRKFREAKLTKDHRTKIWDRLDNAFKVIKEKRFGTSSSPAGATGAPGRRKGVHAPAGRGGGEGSGLAVGEGGKGVHVRHADGEEGAGGTVR